MSGQEIGGSSKEQLQRQIAIYHRKQIGLFILVILVGIVVGYISCFSGVAQVTPGRLLATLFPKIWNASQPLSATEITVLLQLRLPRIVMGFLAGVGLAVGGLVMQAITGNQMASPFTTGLSNAAAMGASVVIVFSLRFMGSLQLATVLGAFSMALLCMLLVYGIAAVKGLGSTTIVLVGIALNYFFSALNAGMQYLANQEQLSAIVNWTFGSLSQATWKQIAFLFVVLAVCVPYLASKGWHYNLLTTGDESAVAMGVNVRRLRTVSGLMVTLMAASVVSFTGVIGFVGLVAPHIARLLSGGDHRRILPLSALLGGELLVAADLVGRTIASPVVVPVGIVVSFIGVPLFVWLILKERGGDEG